MENTNVNQNENSVQGTDDLMMKLISDYENNNDDRKGKTKSKEDILAKYFTPRSSVENFRILPPLAGRGIVEHAFFHYVPVNNATGKRKYRKIYCPAHNLPRVEKLDPQGNVITDDNGNPVLVPHKCALCDKHKAILATQDDSVKFIKKENLTDAQKPIFEKNKEIFKEAGKWEAKKYHIVRGIDKGKPKDGVKFWRFKDNYKNQGVLDKLIPALKLFHVQYESNPTDINKGGDLYINVVDTKMPNGVPYKDVSSITAMKPSKLYDDDIVVKQWLSDKITWRDVFTEASMTKVITSQEYLDRVAKGTDPYWDDTNQDNKRYVFPDPADAHLMAKANEKTQGSLDADSSGNQEMASDLSAQNVVGSSYDVTINNVTSNDVGTDQDDSVDVGKQFVPKEEEKVTQPESQPQAETANVDAESDDNFDDLPF